MITKEQYRKAKKIVEAYDEQLRIADVMRRKRIKEEQVEREHKCNGDHDYISRGKWTSGMVCQDCGKTIDQFITHNVPRIWFVRFKTLKRPK